jgi:hypothetical protein
MVRHAVRVLVVVGLIGLGWVAGRAQAPTSAQSPAPGVSSDFELLVSSTGGETEVRCISGCRLTWAPTGVDMLAPDVRVRGSVSPKGCISPSWMAQNCRILGWQR